VAIYGECCAGECHGDGVSGLGRGVHCGVDWMTALGLEGDVQEQPIRDKELPQSHLIGDIRLEYSERLLSTEAV
jgi:hypothetical protein